MRESTPAFSTHPVLTVPICPLPKIPSTLVNKFFTALKLPHIISFILFYFELQPIPQTDVVAYDERSGTEVNSVYCIRCLQIDALLREQL